MPEKIWSIPSPKLKWKVREPDPEPEWTPSRSNVDMPTQRGHSALAAYLLGPVAGRIWRAHSGGGSFADLVAVLFGVAMVVNWSTFTRWLGTVPYGPSIWLVVVPTMALAVASAWARSIATARTPSSRPGSWAARWGRDPRVVGILGLLIPGLGLMIAKYRRHAAASFWLMGPLAGSAMVLANCSWLWEKSRTLVSPGVRGDTLEIVFASAAAVCVLTGVGWIVQALDGARRVSETRGSSDFAATALLVSVVLFGATFHPASVSRQLYAAATGLQADGFRIIPYALCETAARLDPGTPTYWVEAAKSAESLGLVRIASEHRQLVERRAIEWRVAVGAGAVPREEAAAPGTPPAQLAEGTLSDVR